MQPLLLALVLTTPPGFQVLREADGCTLSLGPPIVEGRRPVRAVCLWPEASLQAARSVLLDFSGYREVVPNIEQAEVWRVEEGRSLVWQLHQVPLFARRESLVWMTPVERADGGLRVDWTSADEPFVPRGNHVVTPLNTGFWEVGAHVGGGVAVVHQVAYDPGVRLPEWIVARFRTNGLAGVMQGLRGRIAGVEGSR